MSSQQSQTTSQTTEDYDDRKKCLEDLKMLVKSEHEQIFSILKKHKVEYSENSNGIFFDLTKLPDSAFIDIKKLINII